MRSTAAGRRYARALFSIAQDDAAVDSVRGELADMARLLDTNPELEQRILRPLHPVAERRAVLTDVCRRGGASRTIQNFFGYLIDQRRFVDFEAIHAEFERLADEAAGKLQAEVVTASPLRDDQRARLVAALSRRTGKQIDLNVRVDPSLLGGAIASVGGLVFDGSIRTQLSQLRVSLSEGRKARSGGAA